MTTEQKATCSGCGAPVSSRKQDGSCRYCGGTDFVGDTDAVPDVRSAEPEASRPDAGRLFPIGRCQECGMPRWRGIDFTSSMRARLAPKMGFVALALALCLVGLVAFMVFSDSESGDESVDRSDWPPNPPGALHQVPNPFAQVGQGGMVSDEIFRMEEGHALEIYSVVFENAAYPIMHMRSVQVSAVSPDGAVVLHNIDNALGKEICESFDHQGDEPLFTETYLMVEEPGQAYRSTFYLTACAPGMAHVAVEMDGQLMTEFNVLSH